MPNCRFIRYADNKARRLLPTSTNPKILNGSASVTGEAVRMEDVGYPMDNVLVAGRKGSVWVVSDVSVGNGPAGTDLVLEVDLGSVQTVIAAGLIGQTLFPGGSPPTQCYLDAIVSVPNTYNNANYVTQNGFAAIMAGGLIRDGGVILSASAVARFFRFRWPNHTSGKGLSLASVVLATAITDIGFLYSGADEQRVRPRAITEGYDQSPMVSYVGPEYVRWAIQFNNNDAALRTILDNLYGDRDPFIFLTPDNEWQECVWGTEEFSREHIWAPPDRYRFLVELRQLS